MMVQAKPPKVWEQEFARLSYEWEKVYAYGQYVYGRSDSESDPAGAY